MKKLFLSGVALAALAAASPALAADMAVRGPVYKAAPAPLPLFNWTGLYIGGHGGYGWGDAENLSPAGWFGGGQIGANWQVAPNWVWGVEADVSGGNLHDSIGGGVPLADVKTDVFGTARLRLGYTVDRTMLYGTGGFAWANTSATDAGGLTDKKTNYGWTVGGGLEYAFAPNWTAKVEYLYADYGRDTYNLGVPTNADLKTNTVKVGVNYLFGGPVSARY